MRPDSGSMIRRYLVQWRNDVDPAITPIGVLTAATTYRFTYLGHAKYTAGFRPFPAFPDLHVSYESTVLFDFFAVRVMDKRRPEYRSFVEALALPLDADTLTVLGRSGGRRKGDFVSVVEEPNVDPDGSTTHTFLVHGVRHVPNPRARDQALAATRPGAVLKVAPEPNNPVNPEALIVTAMDGTALGWVPEGLVPYLRQLLDGASLKLEVIRVNGPEHPDQVRLVVRASGQLPVGAVALPQLVEAV